MPRRKNCPPPHQRRRTRPLVCGNSFWSGATRAHEPTHTCLDLLLIADVWVMVRTSSLCWISGVMEKASEYSGPAASLSCLDRQSVVCPVSSLLPSAPAGDAHVCCCSPAEDSRWILLSNSRSLRRPCPPQMSVGVTFLLLRGDWALAGRWAPVRVDGSPRVSRPKDEMCKGKSC